jgi:hypothetical protein
MEATGKLNSRGGPKLVLLPCGLILAYQGLEEENLDQKLPVPPGWGLVQQASSLLIEKKKLTKKPFIVKATKYTNKYTICVVSACIGLVIKRTVHIVFQSETGISMAVYLTVKYFGPCGRAV